MKLPTKAPARLPTPPRITTISASGSMAKMRAGERARTNPPGEAHEAAHAPHPDQARHEGVRHQLKKAEAEVGAEHEGGAGGGVRDPQQPEDQRRSAPHTCALQ